MGGSWVLKLNWGYCSIICNFILNWYDDSFTQSKPSELIELRRTLTQLNDAVTQVARSGNLEQALQVRDLLAQVKRDIYKLLAEQ